MINISSHKFISLILIIIVLLAIIAGLYYFSKKNTAKLTGVYGENRDSFLEEKVCEIDAGKNCGFDLCQMEAGNVPDDYNCVSGWKPFN